MKQKQKKILEGIVVSDKMDKTVVVKVIKRERHPKYQKLIEKWKKYYAHDENGIAKEGDKVRIIQSRPLSKLKRWNVLSSIKEDK